MFLTSLILQPESESHSLLGSWRSRRVQTVARAAKHCSKYPQSSTLCSIKHKVWRSQEFTCKVSKTLNQINRDKWGAEVRMIHNTLLTWHNGKKMQASTSISLNVRNKFPSKIGANLNTFCSSLQGRYFSSSLIHTCTSSEKVTLKEWKDFIYFSHQKGSTRIESVTSTQKVFWYYTNK